MSIKRLAARVSARSEVSFKRQLVGARESAGLNQSELADLLGVNRSTVCRLERADSNPRLSEIRQYLTQCKAALRIEVISTDVVERQVARANTPQVAPRPNMVTYGFAIDDMTDEDEVPMRARLKT
ncbi:helix-turn-helix transcriptional regulator [Williamsia sp.]|uniref:helix-turn-helix transcriptional regulator n=1 Tax=Williamsia sp. TaxID=1872085 RepID=UPI0039C969A7